LTGRPSIPENLIIESKGRGVLDRPVKPGDDSKMGVVSHDRARIVHRK